MKKATFLFVCAILLAPSFVFSEQLSKIGVVRVSRIIENFPTNSQAFQELNRLKEEYDENLPLHSEYLNQLNLQLIELKNEGDDAAIIRQESEIEAYENFIVEYHNAMSKRIANAREKLKDGSGIVKNIFDSIAFIAVNEGYTLILDAAEQNIIWYSPEIDITDKVIQRLKIIANYLESQED